MRVRQLHNESLDNFELKGKRLGETLDSLGWINKWLGNHNQLIKDIRQVVKKYPHQNSFKIIDLGCGGGDVLRKIDRVFAPLNTEVELMGIDANGHSLDYARNCLLYTSPSPRD